MSLFFYSDISILLCFCHIVFFFFLFLDFLFLFFFFFQAEDGIRDIGVTGVQTCALPIYGGVGEWGNGRAFVRGLLPLSLAPILPCSHSPLLPFSLAPILPLTTDRSDQDRKSTRLNSSHANISYAVFCLKKKNNNTNEIDT